MTTHSKPFTVYCAGTDFDFSSPGVSGDLIAKLARADAGQPGTDWLALPGPGSPEALRDTLRSSGVPDIRGPEFDPAGGAVGSAALQALAGKAVSTADTLSGRSMVPNIAAAMVRLRASCARGRAVNMIGWSRGAVTCVGLANALASDAALRSCPVNLFLIDPVPGGGDPSKPGSVVDMMSVGSMPATKGQAAAKVLVPPAIPLALSAVGLGRSINPSNWAAHFTTLPSTIVDCAVILMEDDTRIYGDVVFDPLTQFERPPEAKVGGVPRERIKIYPMPGVHRSAVIPTPRDADPAVARFNPASRIGAHLGCQFLLQHGTRVNRPEAFLEPNVSLIDLYGALKLETFRRESGPSAPRRLSLVTNGERVSSLFVNDHHRSLFAMEFPVIAAILEPGFEVPRWSTDAVAEVKKLKGLGSMATVVARALGTRLTGTTAPGNRPRHDADDLARLAQALLADEAAPCADRRSARPPQFETAASRVGGRLKPAGPSLQPAPRR